MKELARLGKSLSKTEQRDVSGGVKDVIPPGGGACLSIGDDCNDNVQCCSTVCRAPGGPATGKLCYES